MPGTRKSMRGGQAGAAKTDFSGLAIALQEYKSLGPLGISKGLTREFGGESEPVGVEPGRDLLLGKRDSLAERLVSGNHVRNAAVLLMQKPRRLRMQQGGCNSLRSSHRC